MFNTALHDSRIADHLENPPYQENLFSLRAIPISQATYISKTTGLIYLKLQRQEVHMEQKCCQCTRCCRTLTDAIMDGRHICKMAECEIFKKEKKIIS